MNRTWTTMTAVLLATGLILSACSGQAGVAEEGGQTEGTPAASAGNGAPPESPVEIEFWNILGGDLPEQLVKAYNESQDKVKVKAIYVQNGYEGIVEKLQIQANAGKLPEVVTNGLLYTRFAEEMVKAVPLDPFMERDGFDTDDFYPSMLNLGKSSDGRQIGLPFGISTPVLFYNADLFRAAGLDPDQPPATWEELPEIARTLTRDGKYGMQIPLDFGWLFQAMVETYGGRMMAEDGQTTALDAPQNIEAVQTVADMVHKDKTMQVYAHQGLAMEAMGRGDNAMLITSIAGVGLIGPMAQFELRTAPFPTYKGEKTVPAGGANLMIFTEDPVKQEAAWDFIQFITSTERSAQISTSTGYMVSRHSAFEHPGTQAFLKENPHYLPTYEQIDVMVPWHNFPGQGGTRVQQVIANQIQAVMQGQKTVEQALKDAAAQANEMIQ